MSTCLFCNITDGTVPCHKVWESDTHLAFLSIFPNSEGVTVVIPKTHYPSYAFVLPDDVLADLVLATKEVAHILDEKLGDVGRTAMVFEGFGVDHVHAKLFPMHGTANMKEWKPMESFIETYFSTYPGYISSHDARRADDADLAALAARLRG
jgi:diadenosine tetraphosphate (Ap4A) HIT family hydrolase